MLRVVVLLLLCIAATYTPGHCEARASRDVEHARLPEFLSELDLSSLEASEEDVEALKKIVKRLAPEKNGEYQVYQVFFGNEDLLKEWLKGAGVTGQPGVDYPALTSIPATSFSCRGLRGGYYADLETNCQVFHICDNGRKISFLCPNGTIFQQSQLICDWWFKVDCSKSTELYEQSAEQLAEEERKRADARKMKSEFHRTLVGQQDGYYESADYDGRQNGRTNPYGQEVSAFGPNNVFDDRYHHQREKSEASGERTTKQSRRYHEAGSNYQAGNHLVDASGKFQDSRPGDQSAYGDAHRANSGREKPRNSKSRGPTRNNLLGSSQPQKATPSYTETTTFRSTTASPPREFQQFAESAAFVSNRGNRLNDGKSDRQFYHHSYEQHRLEDRETSTVTQRELDEDSNRVSFTPKTGAPQYPGPTYAPIYKPRTTTIPAYETTLQYAPTTETGFYRQEETTTGEPVTASTDYPTTESTTYPQTPASIGRVPPAANYPQQYADATTRPNTESYDTSEAYPSSTPYEGTESSPSFRQNSISSTEKPWRSTNVYQQSGSTGKTLSPYDTSFTYKQGKVLSTLGPYVPFTKNYVYSSTMSSTPRPAITASTYSPTIADYRITTSNLIPKVKSTSRPKDRATYLPETSTALEDRPYAEREHALSMLHSLQGLESKASEKRPAAPTSRNIPFGPSTLHSLALYFATAGDDSNETAEQPGETGSVELPTSILTQHTIASYAELFNLNNALEGNGTESELTAEADDDEVGEDLEIEESEGPLNAARKTNGTKLRELAQVFTHALSAYLQDPDTFKKVLTEIRPTEPTTTDGGQSADATTFYPTTVEEYSSVTKEKDEVLDFSDDSARRRKPATTTDRSTSHDDYYSTSASQTTRKSVHYPSTTLLPPGDSTETTTQVAGGNTFAYEVNHVFGTTAASDIRGFDARDSTDLSPVYDNYFPSSEDEDGSRNNSFQPYGKNVKPADATPISNYVASSTVASYQPPLGASTSSWGKGSAGDKPVQDLTPPHYQRFGNVKSFEVSNSIVPSQPTTPLPRIEPTYEAASSTVHPFRIRYYESTPSPEDRQSPESLVTARSSYVKFRNNRIEGSRKPAENVATTVATSRDVTATVSDVTPYTGTSANTSGESSSLSDDHWTSSPMVTQLWETTVFVDPRRVNHGLTFSTDDTQPPSTTDSGVNEPELITGAPSTPSTLPPEDNTGETTTSSPWQWAPNDNNSPVAFTLLPTTFAAENTASPIIATRSSVTTTITSSVTTDSVSRGTNPPSSSLPPFTVTAGRWNATENEAMKAQEMFGKLNETSSDTLMRVMKQADNNETVRQLVLLLINHCNGPRNKTMEQEKEQLLDALLRMPVNEFSSEESREIVAGISRLSLPIGKIRAAGAASSSTTTTTTRAPRASSVRPTSSEPSITTFRSSRAGRRFRTTTESTNGFARRSDEDVPADASNSLSEDEIVASDGRALELLRSLYTVAAKWG